MCSLSRKEMSRSRSVSEPAESSMGRLSLFDAVLERNRALNKKSLVHRIVYLGRLGTGAAERRDLGSFSEKLFKQYQQKYQGEGVTGILLIYPIHYVHVVESSSELLHAIISDLNRREQAATGLTQQSKILSFSTDVPQRLFSQWSFRVITLPQSTRSDKYTTTEPISQVVGQCLRQLLELGSFLAKIPRSDLASTMDRLPERVPELMITPDVLEYLVQNSELCSAGKYVSVYQAPCNVVLESELVWPVSMRLFPYTIQSLIDTS